MIFEAKKILFIDKYFGNSIKVLSISKSVTTFTEARAIICNENTYLHVMCSLALPIKTIFQLQAPHR